MSLGINNYEITHGFIRKCSGLLHKKQRVDWINVHRGYNVGGKTPLSVYRDMNWKKLLFRDFRKPALDISS